MPTRHRSRWTVLAFAALLAAAMIHRSSAQETTSGPAAATPSSAPTTASATTGTTVGEARSEEELRRDANAKYFGLWVLAPAVVTIVFAIVLRTVIPALLVGILTAAFMLNYAPGVEHEGVLWGVLAGIRLAFETYLIDAVADKYHIMILIFSMTIGGMVGVIGANGGTRAVVERVSRWASTRRRGQFAMWLAGLIVFFDDYANSMIVGPTMRPIADRLRISRAKLAYIVDSTAAPVASIAVIGTWVGTEISAIDDGLHQLSARPAFLEGMVGYEAFLWSIPYRFYALLAIVMVAIVGLLNRDFGPMRKAESSAAPESEGDRSELPFGGDSTVQGKAWHAAVPILILVGVTLLLVITTGWAEADVAAYSGWDLLREVVTNSNSYVALLYGAIISIVAAILISVATRSLSVADSANAAARTMGHMFPTFIVLILAWTLAGTMEDLHLGGVAAKRLGEADFDPMWLPLLVFVSSAIVSFATGSSWTTMLILCPVTITVAARLMADMTPDAALPVFYAAVGSVLAGSVFGDHCSPISDTTVLSSLASDCTLEQHVWTQMPYALVVAAVSMFAGDVLCRVYNQPWWVGLLAGTGALLLIVLVFGRGPKAPEAVAVASASSR